MQFTAGHGVYESERKNGNQFELDIILKGDFSEATVRDNLAVTVNYEILEQIAAGVMSGPPRRLIETLCKQIGDEIFNRFENIHSLELALRKMNPPLKTSVKYAEIRMQWQR